MNYLFFDIECANCLNGEGKICSFGYVLTDETFNVLKKKDILMDPEAPFLLGNARNGAGIRLAYPLFRFRNSPSFPHFYKEIKNLLEKKDTICFGFAVEQDASFIISTCKRYQLPVINFRFFDIQRMEKELHQKKNPSGLDSLIELYGLDTFTYHRSDDDAYMTMEVYKRLVEDNSLSFEQIEVKFQDCFGDTERLAKRLVERKAIKEKKKRFQEKKVKLFSLVTPVLDKYDTYFWKKKFYLSPKALSNNIDEVLFYKKELDDAGAIFTEKIAEADTCVFTNLKNFDEIAPSIFQGKNHILYSTFMRHVRKLKK